MKGVVALVLFAAVGCQAGIITIRTQVRSLSHFLCVMRLEGSAALQRLPRASAAVYLKVEQHIIICPPWSADMDNEKASGVPKPCSFGVSVASWSLAFCET